jgi:Tol biopolymer transport system component
MNTNFARDGARIVFERGDEIWTANADGGGQQRVSGPPQVDLLLAFRFPAFSPDGDVIAYFDSSDSPMGDIWVVPATGGEPRRVTSAPALGGSLDWTPDGRSIIYSSAQGGARTLWRANIETGETTPVLASQGDDDFPALAPDGKALIYANAPNRYVLTLTNMGSGAPRDLYNSRAPIYAPEYSPDKMEIVFFGPARTGGVQLFKVPAAGGSPRLLTEEPNALNVIPQWAGDGRSLYYYQSADKFSFRQISADDGASRSIVDGWTWNNENTARVSPDGDQILYSRLEGRGPVATFVRDIKTGAEQNFPVVMEFPRWSGDGALLAGSIFEGKRFPGDIGVCAADGEDCHILAPNGRLPVWSADDTRVYFVRGYGEAQEIFIVPADGAGAEEKVMDMQPLDPLGPFYDVNADGDILWVRYEAGRKELWKAELP